MKNVFIEGIQGAGKTTLLRLLGQALPEYHVYWEGDYSPVELAWCTHMTEDQYQEAIYLFPDLKEEILKNTYREGEFYIVTYTRVLAECRAFYEYMEWYEIYNGRRPLEEFLEILQSRYQAFDGAGNVFECSFFQNTMEELLLYYDLSEAQILDVFRKLFIPLKHKNFVMIYLQSDSIEENISLIKKERSDQNGAEMWYPLMLRYLNETPYGQKHPFQGVEDMASHFRHRMEMELKVIEQVIGEQAMVIPAKGYELKELVKEII